MNLKFPCPLFWAGSCLEFVFTGEELHLTFDAGFTEMEPWILIEMNGAPLLRMPLARGGNELCLFRGMTGGIPKRIRVFKETQPITGDPRHRLTVTGLHGSGGELLPVPKKELFLEFIGDSLTSGEGVIGAPEETDWVSPFFSASRTWARLTADLAGADFRAVSQSGWGVCSGWDGDTAHTLPRWYQETQALRKQGPEPDVIFINLGTNDANAIQSGAGPVGPDGFEEGALAFLKQLRAEHPAAKLVWVYGMINGPLHLQPYLERAVQRFGDAWYLPLPEVTPETMGSRMHPGSACHRQAAETAAAFLKKLL